LVPRKRVACQDCALLRQWRAVFPGRQSAADKNPRKSGARENLRGSRTWQMAAIMSIANYRGRKDAAVGLPTARKSRSMIHGEAQRQEIGRIDRWERARPALIQLCRPDKPGMPRLTSDRRTEIVGSFSVSKFSPPKFALGNKSSKFLCNSALLSVRIASISE
jgi:hypothetical protein